MKKRIVVTGYGIVSCFGTDVDHFYEQLLQGKSGVRPIEAFDCSTFSTKFAGEVQDFSVDGYMDKKQARRVDPFIRYAMVAGKKALESAQVNEEALSKLDKSRCGVIIGSGMGGMSVFHDGVKTLTEKGVNRITPFFVPYIITNMGSALLAIDTGFTGPNYSMSTACATSNHSIIAAANHIQLGDADLMVCGGAEAPINPIGVGGFVAMKALSEDNDNPQGASRPWDTSRNGFVVGEGAGVLVLECYEHAKKRGARILAEYTGGHINCDAYHITAPVEDGSGVADCMKKTLENGNILLEEVDYINAHATSTPVGDLCEIRGIRTVFGDQTKNIVINATKSLTGHCLGAAGGIESIAAIKAIETGKIHPTINLKNVEEEVKDLNLAQNQVVDRKVRTALVNSFGFGGHNAVVAFSQFKE